ncbi:MAG: iron-containing alcohol dehydrogenase [Verrucomicrobiales bacterium]
MISNFDFPTAIAHGTRALDELPGRLAAMGARRPLIVTDAGVLETAAFRLLQQALPVEAPVFSEVHSNPAAADVDAAAAAFQRGGCDSVIGFGGGSALDVAKIARAGVAKGASWSELTSENDAGDFAPFVAIPTTAGTGSEVGRSAVITFGRAKRVIFHPALLARLVILDPQVTTGLPPKLTAATGADALVHCIESFTSPVFHPLCDGIALEGARIVHHFLPLAMADGNDLEARGMMLIAAAMGGIAFQKDLGAVHSLSHPLSAHFGLHHGLANALCLLPVMRFNAERKPGLYRRIGAALDLPDHADDSVIGAMDDLLNRISLTGGLRTHGVDESALDTLADAAFADSCHATNPVPVTRDDLRQLYLAAL